MAAPTQSHRNELRKLSRMSFCSRKEDENEHGEPRFAMLAYGEHVSIDPSQ